MRHPKECMWYRYFDRCKFSDCAYKLIIKRNLKNYMELIAEKIKMIGGQIKIKDTEEIVQMQKVNDLEKSEKETAIQEKVDALEKF